MSGTRFCGRESLFLENHTQRRAVGLTLSSAARLHRVAAGLVRCNSLLNGSFLVLSDEFPHPHKR